VQTNEANSKRRRVRKRSFICDPFWIVNLGWVHKDGQESLLREAERRASAQWRISIPWPGTMRTRFRL
jgi:hypothetical protein